MVLLESVLEQTASRLPDRVALVCGGVRLTYGELDARANRLARGLARRGVSRGDRVTIHLEPGEELVLAAFAALKLGAAFTMIHPTTKPAKVARLVADADPRALFVPAAKVTALADALAHEGLRAVVTTGDSAPEGGARVPIEALEAGEGPEPLPKRAIDQDLASILYTSGSTGEAKGVMLTHANWMTSVRSILAYLPFSADDVVFCPLPLTFSYGLSNVFAAFAAGGRLVVERSLAYPAASLGRLVAERATAMPIVPTMAAMLLGHGLEKYDLSSLRWITNAGAALPAEYVRRLTAAVPGVALYCMYGQTECVRAACLEPRLAREKPSSVGGAIPNTEVWLVDEHGGRVGPGGTGELVVRGGHVMRGYWRRPAETAAKLREGPIPGEKVLYTGDLFRLDDEGCLHFVARTDDVIKSRGEKVAPREVEEAILGMDAVAETVVVGVKDPVLGESVKAVVVLRPGATLTAQQVLRHCASRLEDYMVPAAVEFRDALPRTDSGKVAKREL